MSTQFKTGDTVRLKSGGPVMTVQGTSATHPGALLCKWFTDEAAAAASQDVFAPESLQPAKPDWVDDDPTDG